MDENHPSEGLDPTDTGISEKADPYEEFLANLEISHIHAQKAYDALFRPDGPKRSYLYRSLLGRAQSILISLYVQEISRKRRIDRGHSVESSRSFLEN